MSSTQLLHSLLLLLPLRCRRNCNKLISLALLLLSALFAYNEQRQQQTAAEATDDDGNNSSRSGSSGGNNSNNKSKKGRGKSPAATATRTAAGTGSGETIRTSSADTLDAPLYTAVATAVAVVERRSTNKKATNSGNKNSSRNWSRDVSTGTETGTGAAYISWQSSHCHRSPGAQSEAEAQAQSDLQPVLLLSTTATTIYKTRSALALLTSLHKLKSSISPPSIDASFVRLTITIFATIAAVASTRTTNLLKDSCIEAATQTKVVSTSYCCRNSALPGIVAGSATGLGNHSIAT